MVYPHRQVRDQRALDVPDHLLRRQLGGRQNVNLIDRPAVTRNYSRGNNSRQRQDQLLSALDREYAASDR